MSLGSSPHTRGARAARAWRAARCGIIPAYAGSTPFQDVSLLVSQDHPRIRGEHVGWAWEGVKLVGSSPHTRGARHGSVGKATLEGIIPAYAGSTYAAHKTAIEAGGSSPHTRGARGLGGWRGRRRRIIPAYAGSTYERVRRSPRRWDHPRIRGEHPSRALRSLCRSGSSPHTRGARLPLGAPAWAAGIIPAYAGSTRRRPDRVSWIQDHPRIRGEHEPIPTPKGDMMGSSPHTRGAPYSDYQDACQERIIPAYAGSTAVFFSRVRIVKDHPRIRGEHVFRSVGSNGPKGSSPHTRGARWSRSGGRARCRIIPAYAGSTGSLLRACR